MEGASLMDEATKSETKRARFTAAVSLDEQIDSEPLEGFTIDLRRSAHSRMRRSLKARGRHWPCWPGRPCERVPRPEGVQGPLGAADARRRLEVALRRAGVQVDGDARRRIRSVIHRTDE
jgi:hypothetical protein